jgi:hypothetical protein
MKHLSRQTFLQGVGTAVALPFLDAMAPAFAATHPAPARTVIVYAPTGMEMQYWTPQAVGSTFDFPRILKPLERFREDVLVISGLVQNPASTGADGAGAHARAVASYLTATRPKKTEGADIRCGKSIDQIWPRRPGQRRAFLRCNWRARTAASLAHATAIAACTRTSRGARRRRRWFRTSTPG